MDFGSLVDLLVGVDQVSQVTRIVAFERGLYLSGVLVVSSINLPGSLYRWQLV